MTKRHSQNSISARARLRIGRATADSVEHAGKVFKPRPAKPDFVIRIESKLGERMQISAWRFNGRVILSDGIKSVRQLARGIELLVAQSA